ncbi:unnamed protein product, partial [Callosobruchus maculatus]
MDNYAYQPDGGGTGSAEGPFAITRYAARTTNPSDYLVEISSRRKVFKKTGFYRTLSVILLTIAILLLISLIVMTV